MRGESDGPPEVGGGVELHVLFGTVSEDLEHEGLAGGAGLEGGVEFGGGGREAVDGKDAVSGLEGGRGGG